ncbi:FAD synthetase family protein [Aquibacillus sediminis]|uniref:FAD synthetase family protein n=1 Tax=Aquibacillus sediminis TaxID=2574734 RepID=UPI001108F66A|nr:FAD synthetase family protein [Aquibacillus sediminis]
METIHLNASNLAYWKKQSTPNVMALGFFDGVHSGHEQVVKTACDVAKEKQLSVAVMSFFPHPKTILAKDNTAFDYIMPLSKKASILESLGVDTFYVVNCDKDFLFLPPEQFVSNYLLGLGVNHAVAGFDFSYGHRGAGNIDRLKADSSDQIEVTKVDKVDFNGKKISSTWIRELILKGKVEQLANVLGRCYETEVFWDGECFKRLPYYMLPAPGNYRVAIAKNEEQHETEVYVSKSQTGVYLAKNQRLNMFPDQKVEMVWLQQLPVDQELPIKRSFMSMHPFYRLKES